MALAAGVVAVVSTTAGASEEPRTPGRAAAAPVAFPRAAARLEAESTTFQAPAVTRIADAAASGGAALHLWSGESVTGSLTAPAGDLLLRASGQECDGWPQVAVSVDGRFVVAVDVDSRAWRDLVLPGAWPGGTHRLELAFANDTARGDCDRNLRLDAVAVDRAAAPSAVPAGGNLFLGARGYVDPQSPARAAADARRTSDPRAAAALDRVAAGPTAVWYGEWVPTADLTGQVAAQVATETAAGALPVLVASAVPHRECGARHGGGAADTAAYLQWVRALADGIGARRAAVVLEPYALARLDECLTPREQAARTAALAEAVRVLAANPGTAVYLDAGSPGQVPVPVMAERLRAAGVAAARGFALNVGGFATEADVLRTGTELSGALAGKPFVADTSRNGRGPGEGTCNPAGLALGRAFTTDTGSALADAFTWIRRPGESDGPCNGGPAAGTFWAEYAVGLAERAGR
ncbi:hypothetical protein NUM3379_44190 [Kineococcus sp. NUM-3379]